jgi:ring-1,2-phenylacetyl-CoA epoxidase subunit PaaA
MFQDALERWWVPALQLFGPPSKPDDVLLRWHIKSERNEDLRDRYVQKFAPMLVDYGFRLPPPVAHLDADTGRWELEELDWGPLLATFDNRGPDSARRVATANAAWADTAWVRDALDAAAAVERPAGAPTELGLAR